MCASEEGKTNVPFSLRVQRLGTLGGTWTGLNHNRGFQGPLRARGLLLPAVPCMLQALHISTPNSCAHVCMHTHRQTGSHTHMHRCTHTHTRTDTHTGPHRCTHLLPPPVSCLSVDLSPNTWESSFPCPSVLFIPLPPATNQELKPSVGPHPHPSPTVTVQTLNHHLPGRPWGPPMSDLASSQTHCPTEPPENSNGATGRKGTWQHLTKSHVPLPISTQLHF